MRQTEFRVVLLALLLALSAPAATVLRMACGGPGGTDATGNVWAPDSGPGGGAVWPGSTTTAVDRAAMAAQPIPYRNLCYSSGAIPFSRTLTLPAAGSYKLTLLWLEPNKTAAGQRSFSVSANGAPLVANLDLFAVALGALKPYSMTFPVVTAGTTLQIVLTGAVSNALLSAIQVDDVPVIPAVWIPPTCTFANPPSSPQIGQTCVFTDAAMFKSCQMGDSTQGMGLETCRWNGQMWLSIAAPVESPMFPFSSFTARQTQCTSGIVPFSKLNPATPTMEYPLFAADGAWRWDHVILAEVEKFVPDIGLLAGLGRPGSNHDELTGAWVDLGKSSDYASPWQSQPNPPQLSGPYSVVLALQADGAHFLQELTAGSVYYEACGYRVGPMVTNVASHLAGLKSCSGSGTVVDEQGNPVISPITKLPLRWDCAGVWSASIILGDGVVLPLVGTPMTTPTNPSVVWSQR